MLTEVRKLSCAVALVAVPLVLTVTTPAVAYECKTTYVEAEADGQRKAQTSRQATVAWSEAVKSSLSGNTLPWSLWKYAASKSVSCTGSYGNYNCVAKAKPCKYVVF